MPDDVRAARIAYFSQLRVKQMLGLPLTPEEKEYLERVATMQAAQKLSKPLDLEIGPVRIHPPLDLEIGPARILDMDIGPARIQQQTGFGSLPPATAAVAVQNLEALTRAGVPQAFIYGYHRGLTRPMPEVASAQAEQSVRPEVRVMPMLPSDASMDNLTFDNEVLLNGIYGDHLKAADSYGGDLPDEYFDDRNITSPEVRRNIRAGVRELQRRRNGKYLTRT